MDKQSKDQEIKKRPKKKIKKRSKDMGHYSVSEEEDGDTAEFMDIKPQQAIVSQESSSSRKKHSDRRRKDEKEGNSREHKQDRLDKHKHIDENVERFGNVPQQTRPYQREKQFVSRLYKSKKEFMKEYKRFCQGEAKARLYRQMLTKLKKAIIKGNIDVLKNLSNIINYTKDADEKTLRDFYAGASNPIKDTNLVILACKYNKVKVLEWLFASDNRILSNLTIGNTETTILPYERDEEQHNAFYYAIRSSNIELLDVLIGNWPSNYFTVHLRKLDEVLSKAYEELKLKNVSLSDKMEIFVENKLIDLRFFSNTLKCDQSFRDTLKLSKALSNIKKRIKLILKNISALKREYLNMEVDEKFLFVAKFIAQNIYILKQQLKATDHRLPLEEIEFCLVAFISSYIKQQDINLFYRFVLNKSKILNHLENFAKEIKQYITEDINIDKGTDFLKLKREKVVAEIISHPQFEELYNDYQQIRDIQSLKKISDYIKLALSADCRKREDQFIITIVIQVIGEHLKNTVESPKLSNTTSELSLLALPKYTRKIFTDLRNLVSHAYSLFKITEIEENKDVNFFIGIQSDIKKVGDVITDIFHDKKLKIIRILLKKVINCENLDEIKEIVEVLPTVELNQLIEEQYRMMEHEKFENLIKELNDITEKTFYENYLFGQLNDIIKYNIQSKNITNYVTTGALLRNVNICLNVKMMNHNDIERIKININQISKHMALELNPLILKDIATLSMKISHIVGLRIQDDTLNKMNRLIWEIFFIVVLATDDIECFKKLIDELNTKDSFIPIHEQKEIHDVTEEKHNQLELKLLELRNILNIEKVNPNKNILNNKLLSSKVTKTISFYKDDEKLQAIIQMLVMDIISILDSSKEYLKNNHICLDDNTPLLSGKSLRNHLAHDNVLVDILLSNSKTANSSSKLRKKYKHDLVTITNQNRMFAALEEGNLESLKDCLRKGADLNARSINSWTTLHFAAKGPSLEVIEFLLDQNLSLNVTDINGQSPLHVAAMHGRKNIMDFFIKKAGLCTIIDNLDDSGKTPLHIAAQYGHKDIVVFLLKNKANTFIQDVTGLSPLYYAMRNNHVNVAMILLKNKEENVDVNEAMGGFTPLHEAAENGHFELVNFLLEHKADVNARNDRDFTPIHAAAFNGHLNIVNTLILKGADVNAKVINGFTPLHYAAETGHEMIVSILLKHEASIHAIDKIFNGTALHYAAKNGHEEIVKLLLNDKANASANTVEGITPLHLAVQSGHLKTVTILLKHGVNINAKDKNNVTPLHYAVKSGHKEVAEVLITNGGEVNAKTNSNVTPLHEAAMRGYTDIIEFLIKHKAEVNAQDIHGSTPLHAAAMNGSTDVIDLLIKKKADVNARTKFIHITPLHIAAVKNHTGAIDFLIKTGADVNAKTIHNVAPLHAAILTGHKNVIEHLIKNKAHVDVGNNIERTPLLLAVAAGRKEIVEILIENKANINIKIDCKPLLSAIDYNNKEIVEVLVANGANVNAEPEPLLLAAHIGCKDIVDILLKTTSVNIKGRDNITPLHVAAAAGHKEIVNALITNGADIDATCIDGKTPLYLAAHNGYEEVVEILIRKEANVNVSIKGYNRVTTPLHVAATFGHTNVVKMLLKKKVNINIEDYEGRTALVLAVSHGRLEVVKALLQYQKENMNDEGNVNYTILHIACQESNLEMVKCLVDNGFDINAKNTNGSKPAHIAAREGHKDTVEFFLSKGLSVNESTKVKQTLLHYATMKSHLAVIEYLIEEGADVNAQDMNGQSPMHIAASCGYKNVIEVLLKNGAIYNVDNLKRKSAMTRDKNVINLLTSTEMLFQTETYNDFSKVKNCIKLGAFVNAKNADGKTPLHFAAKKGSDRVVRLLLQNRANSNAVDNKGLTPLHYAAKFCYLKVVKTLLSYGAVYNAASKNDKMPLNLTKNEDIISLFKLVNESFKNIQNDNSKVIRDLDEIKDVDTIKAIMGARDRKNKTLVVVAVHNKFLHLERLKQISQGEVSSQLSTASALFNQSKHQEALSIYKSIFEKRKEILGPDNPGTLDIQTCIAKALYAQGCYQGALNTLEEIFQKQKEVLGLNNTDTLNTRSTIALVLHGQGRNEEAFNICQEVYQKQKTKLGQRHSDTLDTRLRMALVLNEQGKYEEALSINRIIFEKYRKMSDLNIAASAVYAQNNKAMVLCNQGKHAEALKIYKKVFKKMTIFGTHSDTLKTLITLPLNNIVRVLFRQKKYHDILKNYREVLDIQKSVLGPNHIDTLSTQYNIANVLFAQAKWIGALKEYKNNFDQLKSVCGLNHPRVFDILKIIKGIKGILKLAGITGIESEVFQHLQKDINIAVSDGDIETVQRLLKDGFNINDKDIDGKTTLHYAVISKRVDVVNILLKTGADVTQVTNNNTPLHLATATGCREMVKVLLEHVSRNNAHVTVNYFINAKTANGSTSLHIAADNGYLEIVKSLMEYGATYNIENNESKTPLNLSKYQNITNFLQLVEELFEDAKEGNIEIINKLEAITSDEFAAAITARNCQGNTLLQVTRSNKHMNIASKLLEMLQKPDQDL